MAESWQMVLSTQSHIYLQNLLSSAGMRGDLLAYPSALSKWMSKAYAQNSV